jgi:hypothetical protein
MALLLTPREREVEKQKEQERAAKELGSIGKRVDELRELEQSAKKRLEEFQEKEFARFSEKRLEQEAELKRLDEEVEVKKQELADYFEKNPVDKKWLLYVKTEKAAIEATKAEQADFAAKLNLQLAKQTEVMKSQEDITKSLKQEKTVIAGLREQAEADSCKATEVLSQAQNEARGIRQEADREKWDVHETLKKAQTVLREAELKKEQQDQREKELEDRELAVLVQELKFYSPITSPNKQT